MIDSTEISVIAGAAALIGFIVWNFFGERAAVAASLSETGVQEITVTVKGGESPDVIVENQGVPVKLDFYRDETASCTE
ncbi:MAG: cupredoxin domain-containing protein, partial [Gemmatimonadaceae bacterium]